MSFHTGAPWVTSTFNHLDGWWPSLGLASTFSVAGVFRIDLAVVGVAVMQCFLGSAVGSAGVFLLFRFSRLISESSEWTTADTHSFSDGGEEQRLESMRAATVVLTSSAGSSLFRLVMVHYRIVVQYVISIRSFSFPFPLPSLLPPSCWFTVYHAWMHLLPPPPHTNIHTYPSITSSFVTVCNLLNVTFF